MMKKVDWTGVEKVEFKMWKFGNKARLMEWNGRFWGSLQLSVECGVYFPYRLYNVAINNNQWGSTEYKVGVKSRWELGDLDHLLLRLFKKGTLLNLPGSFPSRLKVSANFLLDFLRPSVKHEVMKLDDPVPFLCELKRYLKDIFNRH